MNTISTKISDLKGLDYITEVATPDLVTGDYGEDIKKEDVGDYVTQVGIASALTKQFENASETKETSSGDQVDNQQVEPSNDPTDEIVVDDSQVDAPQESDSVTK